jgi:uncharacterized protein (DUF2147 family)
MRTSRILAAIVHSIIGLVPIATTSALAADPLGIWLTGDRKGKVNIVDCGGAICGNLIWMLEPLDPATNMPKIDRRNVDPSLQGRPLIGIPIILNMTPSSTPQKWVGDVYNAEDGKTYAGSFALTGENTAQLKGCVLGGLICKAQNWTRASASYESPSASYESPSSGKGAPLRVSGGTFVVPVEINGAIKLNFTVDSCASVVLIPADVFSTLTRTGTITRSDIIGEQTYVLADGSNSQSVEFNIRSLKVGDKLVANVRGGVAPSRGSLLLGQSFLGRFRSWSIDNKTHRLLLGAQ